MIAPTLPARRDASGWRLPRALAPWLEPEYAAVELARRFPALEIVRFGAERVDTDDGKVALQGTAHVREGGAENLRCVLIRVDEGGAPIVRLSPDDPGLPHLGAAMERLRADLAGAPGRGDAPGLQVLSHRFGRRACLLVTGFGGRRLARLYARRGDDALVATLGLLAAHRDRLSCDVPRVTSHDRTSRLVLLTWLDGSPLHGSLAGAPAGAAAAAGRAVRALQTVPAASLPPYGRLEELATIRKLSRRAGRIRPTLAPRLEAARRTLEAAGDGHPGATLVPAHRDLHDKQVIVRDGAVGLIDWDWATASPAALDPGNFLAHLGLRALQGRIDRLRAETLRKAFLEGYAADGGTPADLERWETLAQLRLAAVYAVRPRWPGLAEALLAAVQERVA